MNLGVPAFPCLHSPKGNHQLDGTGGTDRWGTPSGCTLREPLGSLQSFMGTGGEVLLLRRPREMHLPRQWRRRTSPRWTARGTPRRGSTPGELPPTDAHGTVNSKLKLECSSYGSRLSQRYGDNHPQLPTTYHSYNLPGPSNYPWKKMCSPQVFRAITQC